MKIMIEYALNVWSIQYTLDIKINLLIIIVISQIERST